MKVLGVTGGIGSGKSMLVDYMGIQYNARVIKADTVGHQLMQPFNTCYDPVVELFGSRILNEDQTINHSKLASVVFKDEHLLQHLNAIIHPAVKKYIMNEISTEKEKGRIPFLVIEAALLIEDHYDIICDELWYIYADEDIRRQRLIRSRGYTNEKIDQIFSSQLPDKVFRKHCHLVIDNNYETSEIAFQQIEKGLKDHEFM